MLKDLASGVNGVSKDMVSVGRPFSSVQADNGNREWMLGRRRRQSGGQELERRWWVCMDLLVGSQHVLLRDLHFDYFSAAISEHRCQFVSMRGGHVRDMPFSALKCLIMW